MSDDPTPKPRSAVRVDLPDEDYGGTVTMDPERVPGLLPSLPFRTEPTVNMPPERPIQAGWPARPPSSYVSSGDTVAAPLPALGAPHGPPFLAPPAQHGSPHAPHAPPHASHAPPLAPPAPAAPPPHAAPPAPTWGSGLPSAFLHKNAPASVRTPQPPIDLRHAPERDVYAASDAAAQTSGATRTPAGVRAEPPRERGNPRGGLVELVAFEAAEIAAMRGSRWLREEDREDEDDWVAAGDLPKRSSAQSDRAAVHQLLVDAPASDLDALEGALTDALEGASGEWPIVLLSGPLTMGLDELHALRTLRDVAAAWASPPDKRLSDALDSADALLRLESAPPLDAVQVARGRIDDALRSAGRPGVRDLEPTLDRTLLETRRFVRRTVMGAPRVVAHVALGGSSLPAYISETMALELPLFRQFNACLVAEVRTQQDASEACPLALRVLAMGRVLPPLRGRSRQGATAPTPVRGR